jgi:hypothetical protein
MLLPRRQILPIHALRQRRLVEFANFDSIIGLAHGNSSAGLLLQVVRRQARDFFAASELTFLHLLS